MLCKICYEVDEGQEVVICSNCVQVLLGWPIEKAKQILVDLIHKLERAKSKTERQRIKDKIKWIERFKGLRRRR